MKTTKEQRKAWREALSTYSDELSTADKVDLLDDFAALEHQLADVTNGAAPHITPTGDGGVSFEWWGHGDRKLTIIVRGEDVWFLKSWDDGMGMEDGDANPETVPPLFLWLFDATRRTP